MGDTWRSATIEPQLRKIAGQAVGHQAGGRNEAPRPDRCSAQEVHCGNGRAPLISGGMPDLEPRGGLPSSKRLVASLVLAAVLALGMSAAQASAVRLVEFAFNLDGVVSPDAAPSSVDLTNFDTNTGLGTVVATVTGEGAHAFDFFVDHDVDEGINGFFNEFGDTVGSAAAGQSWEIDEPGFAFGDIYDNFLASALDNTNGVPSGSEDDVSMALGWDFTLAADEAATITYLLSETDLLPGLSLLHVDPDSEVAIRFSSSLEVVPVVVPAPSSNLLMITALLLLSFLWEQPRGGVRRPD